MNRGAPLTTTRAASNEERHAAWLLRFRRWGEAARSEPKQRESDPLRPADREPAGGLANPRGARGSGNAS